MPPASVRTAYFRNSETKWRKKQTRQKTAAHPSRIQLFAFMVLRNFH